MCELCLHRHPNAHLYPLQSRHPLLLFLPLLIFVSPVHLHAFYAPALENLNVQHSFSLFFLL